MKKITVLLSALLCVCMIFSACAGITDYKEKPVDGYSKPFNQQTEKYIQKLLNSMKAKNPDDDAPQAEITWQGGWVGDDAPDESAIEKNEKPVTCRISIFINSNDEEKRDTRTLAFFFAYNTDTGKLKVNSAAASGKDYHTLYTRKQAEDLIKEIYMIDQIVI